MLIWIILIGIVGIVYLGLYLFAILVGPKMIFPAPPSTYGEELPSGFVKTKSGEDIAYTYLPNEKAEFYMIYSHGNGEDLGMVDELMHKYHENGFSVLAYDYPGYGLSSGHATEESCFAAIDRVYEFLVKEQSVSPEKIIVYGRSLGGGPATYLASERTVGGLVLEGTFTSTYRVITKIKLLPMDVFDSKSRIKKITVPSLVVHGTLDKTVPYSHGETLYRLLPESKRLYTVHRAGHNDVISIDVENYKKELNKFMSSLSPSSQVVV